MSVNFLLGLQMLSSFWDVNLATLSKLQPVVKGSSRGGFLMWKKWKVVNTFQMHSIELNELEPVIEIGHHWGNKAVCEICSLKNPSLLQSSVSGFITKWESLRNTATPDHRPKL